MKLKTRLPFLNNSSVPGNDDKNFTARKITPMSPSPPHESLKSTMSIGGYSNSSLQSYSSLQTLPSVPSLQLSFLVDNDDAPSSSVTVTASLTSTVALSSSITSLSVSSSLLYVSAGHEINVYDCATMTLLDTFNVSSPSSGAVKSIAFSNGKVLTAHLDGKIRVWKLTEKASSDSKTRERKHKLVTTLPTLTDRLMHFPVPKNHVKVRRHKTRLWLHHNDAVSSLAATPTAIYSVSWDKTLKTWDPHSLKCRSSLTAGQDAVNAVAVSGAGDGAVYTASADGRINVWGNDDGSGKVPRGLTLAATLEKHKSAVNALTLSSDGTVLYSGACDRSILVWERVGGEEGMRVSGALRGHGGAILCLVNVGEFLVSGSADRTVRIWRRGGGGDGGGGEGEGREFECLAVLRGHVKGVKCLAAEVVAGGEEISVFSGGLDGEVRVWSVRVCRS